MSTSSCRQQQQLRKAVPARQRVGLCMVAGDEYAATRSGNNNWYGHDNEMTWFDWDSLEEQRDGFFRFYRCAEMLLLHSQATTLMGSQPASNTRCTFERVRLYEVSLTMSYRGSVHETAHDHWQRLVTVQPHAQVAAGLPAAGAGHLHDGAGHHLVGVQLGRRGVPLPGLLPARLVRCNCLETGGRRWHSLATLLLRGRCSACLPLSRSRRHSSISFLSRPSRQGRKGIECFAPCLLETKQASKAAQD